MTTLRSAEAEMHRVRGERSVALVHGARSLQSRVSAILAASLMIALGLGALTWYYAHAFTHQSRARQVAQASATDRAQGEMPLPSLGPIEAPRVMPMRPPAPPDPAAQELPLAEMPAPPGAAVGPAAGVPGPGVPRPTAPAHGPSRQERRLAGVVFTRTQVSPVAPGGATTVAEAAEPRATEAAPAAAVRSAERTEEGIGPLLHSAPTPAARAQLLPDLHFLLAKGAFIDCTLETAIDSTLPGMTTCVTAADTFSADGTVVLLERGTKLVGETRGQVQQGQARVFVVWTQARTPTGVSVPLESPGTDELGRAGLPGEVERHFWERFGAAMLVSLLNGAVQAGVQAATPSGSALIYAPGASQDVATEILKETLRISPTVVKRNGDRIEVLVARDVDFRSVYELATPSTGR
jgi:type IV secretion system protein VirB10